MCLCHHQTDAREGKINKVESKHQESVDKKLLSETKNMLQTYFLTKAINNDDRKQKERLRNSIIEIVIINKIITKAFLDFNDDIKCDHELVKAFEEVLETLVGFGMEEAAVILDEFRVH